MYIIYILIRYFKYIYLNLDRHVYVGMLMISFFDNKNENETVNKQLFCKMIILLKLAVVNDVPS